MASECSDDLVLQALSGEADAGIVATERVPDETPEPESTEGGLSRWGPRKISLPIPPRPQDPGWVNGKRFPYPPCAAQVRGRFCYAAAGATT